MEQDATEKTPHTPSGTELFNNSTKDRAASVAITVHLRSLNLGKITVAETRNKKRDPRKRGLKYMASHFLEITLISAQGLKLPSTNKRMQTYALAWVNPSTKLRTQVDRVGGENPTWNDKFLFKVTPEFLSSETSAVSVEIYSTGYLRDHVVGSVRVLISNIALFDSTKTPSFTALQIRRPSGRVQGVLNIGAMLMEGSAFAGLNECDAIGYRDLMGESEKGKRQWVRKSKSMADDLNAVCSRIESLENSSCAGSPSSERW
ncbi:hypothetical protein Patl1_00537 [Pistacia atlantica]|uniref:Uncharacterized protein n=1 Tax=Pistacia atlantica TaxID=434234 RepID=A0ACC1C4U9_9ROSI|nr:hypothetical protein Patl1_00537 [Pistacia atlantica]